MARRSIAAAARTPTPVVARLLAAGIAAALTGCSDPPRQIASRSAGLAIDDATFDAALALALDGNAAAALDRLSQLPPAGLGASQRNTLACLQRRFAPHAASLDPDPLVAREAQEAGSGQAADDATHLAEHARQAFRAHWTLRLSGPAAAEDADASLASTLLETAGPDPLLPAPAGAWQARADVLTSTLARRLRASGYGVLDGITPPLREWIVWRAVDERHSLERVELPDGDVTVRLTRVSTPLSRGWVDWASCGRHATRGWVAPDGGIVVVDAEAPGAPASPGAETWRVELLAHEAQHVADLRRWPRLADADLEFRAKLVEVALTRAADRAARVAAIAAQAHRDRASPHALASWHVVAALRARRAWPADASGAPAEPAALRDAALAALREHARDVDAGGVEDTDPHSGRRVVGVLPP